MFASEYGAFGERRWIKVKKLFDVCVLYICMNQCVCVCVFGYSIQAKRKNKMSQVAIPSTTLSPPE